MITTMQCSTIPDKSEGSHWYALHTMSNCEVKVATYLRALDVETFLPVFSRRKRIDRAKMIHRPLIPGYVFCRWPNKLKLRIPMMSISQSDLMPIRSERSDARLSQCESMIGIRQQFCSV